jgi:iron complex transport system ATP-binding protein
MLELAAAGVDGRLSTITTRILPGKVTAICGPNGAGKSTLLSLLAGLLAPDSGSVLLDGHVLGAMPHKVGAQADARAVDAALASMVLGDLAQRPLSTLSGGEQARAMLARVLAGEPRWILADEPLASLDLAHQAGLLGHFRRLAADGKAVVVVLHDLAAAMNWADRVLVLHQGSIVSDGAPVDALASDVLARVWQVRGEWLGSANQRALLLHRPD